MGEFDNAISLIKLSRTQTLTLDDFIAEQRAQGEHAFIKWSLINLFFLYLLGVGEFDNAISLIKLSRTQTLTLDDFIAEQRAQGEPALIKMNINQTIFSTP